MRENKNTTAEIDVPEAESRRPVPSRRLRALWWLRALILLIGAPVLMAIIAAVLLIGREVSAPSWIVRDVEVRAAEVLAGGSLGFGAMKVTIGRDFHPRLVLVNAVLRDAEGGILARVPRIETLVSPRGVLQGRFLAQEIRLRGAQVSLRRSNDGTVALAFDQGATAIGSADGFLGLLDQIDKVFSQGALEALEQVRATGLIINHIDARAGRSWVIDDGRIALDLQDGGRQLRANVALLSGRSYVTNAELTYRSPRGSRTAQIGLTITDAAAADIASQSPLLSWLGVLDAPISGAVRGKLNEDGRLTSVSATLQIGAGELRPNSQTRPIPFNSARTYISYDPLAKRLTFDLIEVDSALGRVAGTARTYLREFEDGWPLALLGQLQFSEISSAPDVIFDSPVHMSQANLDFRLRLDPFTLDIGQAVLVSDAVPLRLRGQVSAGLQGWSVALDLQTDVIGTDQVIALWPTGVAALTRDWLVENVQGGDFYDSTVVFRARPDAPPSLALSMEFSDANVAIMPTLPPIEDAGGTLSIIDRRVAMTLDRGHVTAPVGGRIEMAGSTMVIPRTGVPNTPARFDLSMQGRLTAVMAILNLEPFDILRNVDLPVSFAQGRASIQAVLETPLGQGVTPDQRVWSVSAQVRNVKSDLLIPNRTITASALEVVADPESLVVRGPVQLGDVAATMTFSRALGAGSQGTARVDATVSFGPAFLDAFNINLPPEMITGAAPAQIAIDLSDPNASAFRLTSDLRGVGLSLVGFGWSKARDVAGSLTIVGQLGNAPRIDELSIAAPGLQTTGTIRLASGGGLYRAAFERVRLGGWLDAPVVLLGHGAGRPFQVQIAGGSLDLREANFDTGGGGEGAPLDIALDRLQITDGIAIENFRGTFTSPAGLQGQFQGDVNGTTPIRGTLVPVGGRAAVRIVSDDAGGLFRAAGILRNVYGGAMEMTLIPAGAEGSYDGTLIGTTLRIRDAPALASLLDGISVVGLLAQMRGQGLLFSDVEAQFRLTPDRVIVTQSSAVGPSLGISLDGIYNQAARTMDFQGVVSPFFLINGIGAIFTRPGEGLIGFNFNLRGPVDNPTVLVNPLSALTPGMFRDIFRRSPPTVGQ
ncbi:hypothetical protein OAN307_c28650 [Octadecabacter antarcticus 307]|uniref:DUF3971 domain-containing protein n=1 Tax=Octadecabacter antarcticus 307 TaxID=391626 RepID=M9R9G9_9RHOB|nr:DUF3971 domain-containing protein [Octadecabacter antarcticus]AGI68433.1 hypothetical protein OAN307_c28650 [Octadecabacter antarcticus 307]